MRAVVGARPRGLADLDVVDAREHGAIGRLVEREALVGATHRRPFRADAFFFARFEEGLGEAAITALVGAAEGFEDKMSAVRRAHAEQAFRIGVQVMSGAATAADAGPAYADLADICVRSLAPAALAETARVAGTFDGDVAVVALGKFGGREMTARSDLDLMTVYAPAAPGGVSSLKGWSADTW